MNKRARHLFAAALAAILVGVLSVGALAGEKKFLVGYATSADTDVYVQRLKETFGAFAAKDPSMEVVYSDAGGDNNRQLDQIDNFLIQGVDAIVVVPVDYAGVTAGVEKANEAGIPVIALCIEAEGGKVTFVGSANRESGEMQGAFIRKNLKKGGKVVHLGGYPGYYHTIQRREGFLAESVEKRPDIVLLAEQPGNYDRDKGMLVMEDWIQSFPEIDAVVAANDQMALGAIEALKAADRIDNVLVCGVDGLEEALDAIEEGHMSYTVLQNAEAQAETCYKTLKDILAGKPAPERVIVPFEPITRDNYAKYRK